jgi:hypothetical protein
MSKKINYNQSEVNQNMESLLDLAETPTIQDRMKNIIRSDKEVEVVTEKQSEKPKKAPRKKAPSRGGARAGSGRPKGSTNKITPTEMLDDFKVQSGLDFHQFINEQIVAAHLAGDKELVSKYLLGFAKYLVQDVQEVKQDVTSNGQTMNVGFTFPSIELSEWKNESN